MLSIKIGRILEKEIEAKRIAVEEAKGRWQAASIEASKLASTLFQPGSGYGDPEARLADEHKLRTAKDEAERLYREFNDLDRNLIDQEMLSLQRSQKRATWASFVVAAAVGMATIVQVVIALSK